VHDSIIDVSPFLVLRETIGRVQREGKKKSRNPSSSLSSKQRDEIRFVHLETLFGHQSCLHPLLTLTSLSFPGHSLTLTLGV